MFALLLLLLDPLYNFRLHLTHEMQTIVTGDRKSVSLPVSLSVTRLNSAARAVCAGSFGAAFAKSLWPFLMCIFVFDYKLCL